MTRSLALRLGAARGRCLVSLSRCFLQRRCSFRRDAGALCLDRSEPVLC
jgi:hypothetical protein